MTKSSPPRAWQRMLSGRRLDLLNPSPMDIEIDDIAHGLARVARWNGQTQGDYAFTVAQHCLLVEDLLVRMSPDSPARDRLAALLHDAAEYVIGDIISPFKAAIGPYYKEMESGLQTAVHIRFGLAPTLPARLRSSIKKADKIAAYTEAVQLAGFSEAEARKIFGNRSTISVPRLVPMAPNAAKSAYLAAFRSLIEEL